MSVLLLEWLLDQLVSLSFLEEQGGGQIGLISHLYARSVIECKYVNISLCLVFGHVRTKSKRHIGLTCQDADCHANE